MKQCNVDEITILLFEDDEGHAELVRMNLERSGLSNRIIRFPDGESGLAYLADNAAMCGDSNGYLILLDINMPGIDGHEVLSRIKRDERTRRIPVVMLTTAANNFEVERSYEEGCSFYINKPLDYEDFARAIKELGLFIQTATIPGIERVLAKN